MPPLNSAVGRQTSFHRQLNSGHHEHQNPSWLQDPEVLAMAAFRYRSPLGPSRIGSLQNALRHSHRNMSKRRAHSSPDKSLAISPQELRIEGRGGFQKVSTVLIVDTPTGLCANRPWFQECPSGWSACRRRDREIAYPGHCRPTNRCSEPGHIKCLAAGGQAMKRTRALRARVLRGQRAVAELNR